MKNLICGSALTLPLLLCTAPALADELPETTTSTGEEIIALGLRADAHGPAGTMADHVHERGSVMVALTWMHEEAGGTTQSGSGPIDDAGIIAAGYTARTQSMTMDMAMLHLMWAPSDRVTLMLVPSWMRMDMTMVGIAPSSGHGHHSLAVGETMKHSSSGIGDTQVAALVSLSRRPELSAHAGLTLSVPTGSVSLKDEDGNFLHYGMQSGSGTWDIQPSFTLRGATPGFGWGVQTSYLFRAENRNASGFRFGDRFAATAWLSKPVTARVSLSARLAWSDEGKVKGHYNSGHNHASPADRQANYGGQRLEAGLGANVMLGNKLRLGVEGSLPLYQDLNGIQAPRQFASSVTLSRMF